MATLAATFDRADKSTPGYYGPSQTALLLLDFHSTFIYKFGAAKAPAAFEVAAKLRTWAKSQGIQVIHALNDLDSTAFPTCKNGIMFAGVIGAMKSSGDEEPPELLEGGDSDVTFVRRLGHISALKSPGLDDFLERKGIKSLILTGLSTSGCVLRTAAAASDAEYVVSVISDGCADPDDSVHDFLVAKILNGHGYVASAAEFQEGYAKATGGK